MIERLITDIDLGTIDAGEAGLSSSDPAGTIASVISTTIGLMTVIGGVFFIFNIITASMAIITSAGDKGNLEQARTKMTHSFVGLVVTISALFIVGLLTTVLGIPNFLNFSGMIGSL